MSVGLPSNRWELSYEANDAGPGQLGCRTGALAIYIQLLTHIIQQSKGADCKLSQYHVRVFKLSQISLPWNIYALDLDVPVWR